MHFLVALRFHGRADYINILSHVEKRWRTLWVHGRTGGFISDPSIPDVTPKRLPRRTVSRIVRFAGSAWFPVFGQTEDNDRPAAALYIHRRGRGYQVISLSRPLLGDNYRRTIPRDVFPRFSADWQNVYFSVSPLKASREKYTRSFFCHAELCNN